MSDNEEEVKVNSDTVQKDDKNKDVDLENAENMDEQVFTQNNDLLDDQVEHEFTCTEPQTKSGHIVYKCRGLDS
jgi:hypothetical protein